MKFTEAIYILTPESVELNHVDGNGVKWLYNLKIHSVRYQPDCSDLIVFKLSSENTYRIFRILNFDKFEKESERKYKFLATCFEWKRGCTQDELELLCAKNGSVDDNKNLITKNYPIYLKLGRKVPLSKLFQKQNDPPPMNLHKSQSFIAGNHQHGFAPESVEPITFPKTQSKSNTLDDYAEGYFPHEDIVIRYTMIGEVVYYIERGEKKQCRIDEFNQKFPESPIKIGSRNTKPERLKKPVLPKYDDIKFTHTTEMFYKSIYEHFEKLSDYILQENGL